MGKPTLYLDCDGVLIDSVAAICDMYNDDYALYPDYKEVTYKDINTWEFKELNCTNMDIINMYFNSPRFFRTVHFYDAMILEYLKRISFFYKIVIVTTGYKANLAKKNNWLGWRFSKYIDDIILVDLDEYADKSHIDMSGGVFVDDSSKNLKTSNADYKICFGEKRGWNDDWTGIRRKDWNSLTNCLISYVSEKGNKMEFLIKDVDRAMKVADITSKYSGDILACRGNVAVDASSIVGLLALDISKPITFVCLLHSDTDINKYFNELKEVVDEV